MDLALEGKVALVFGGANGIGRETAHCLAAEGTTVVVADRDEDAARELVDALREAGREAASVPVDITRRESVQAMAAQVLERYGAPDILVHSAGIASNKRFVESELEDWLAELHVNLTGPMLCTRALLPAMIERQRGRIIAIASDAARVGQARLSYYAAAKAGAIAFIKSLAQEVGRYHITANVVSPGATNTPLRIRREEEFRRSMGEAAYAERVRRVVRMYPLGRLGEPVDVASAVVYLASESAGWITGQVLSVNGGFTMP